MASSGEPPENRPGAAAPAESPTSAKQGPQTGRPSRIVDMTEQYLRRGHGGLIVGGVHPPPAEGAVNPGHPEEPARPGAAEDASSPTMSEAQRALRSKLEAMGFKEAPDDGIVGFGFIGGVHPDETEKKPSEPLTEPSETANESAQTARSRLLAMGFKEEPDDGRPGTIIVGVGQRKP